MATVQDKPDEPGFTGFSKSLELGRWQADNGFYSIGATSPFSARPYSIMAVVNRFYERTIIIFRTFHGDVEGLLLAILKKIGLKNDL